MGRRLRVVAKVRRPGQGGDRAMRLSPLPGLPRIVRTRLAHTSRCGLPSDAATAATHYGTTASSNTISPRRQLSGASEGGGLTVTGTVSTPTAWRMSFSGALA